MADNDIDNWVTVPEAAASLRVSDRTVRRRIDKGELEAKLEGRRLMVKIDSEVDTLADTISKDAYIEKLESEIEWLRKELQETRQRSDTIILGLTQQMQESQRLLEHHRQPWWRRWRRKKDYDDRVQEEVH